MKICGRPKTWHFTNGIQRKTMRTGTLLFIVTSYFLFSVSEAPAVESRGVVDDTINDFNLGKIVTQINVSITVNNALLRNEVY